MFIICCVPAEILYLGKILFLRCRPKYSQPIKLHNFQMNSFSTAKLSQSGLRTLKFTVSQESTNVLHAGTNSYNFLHAGTS